MTDLHLESCRGHRTTRRPSFREPTLKRRYIKRCLAPGCELDTLERTRCETGLDEYNHIVVYGYCPEHWVEKCYKDRWDEQLSICINEECDSHEISLTTRQDYNAETLVERFLVHRNFGRRARRQLFF